MLNRDENLGFQDFIIDKISGKKSIPKSPSLSSTPIESAVIQKEETPLVDVLANIPLNNQTESISPRETIISPTESTIASSSPSMENATIPDWLKESTSLGSHIDAEDITPLSEDILSEESQTIEDIPVPIVLDNTIASEDTASLPNVPDLPDWLKGGEAADEIPQDTSIMNPIEELHQEETTPEEYRVSDTEQVNTSDESMSNLPAWMQGIDQESLKNEVEEEINSTPAVVETENASSYEDIPDWLKSTTIAPVTADNKSKEDSDEISEGISSHREKTESKQKHSPSPKKPVKTLAIQEE